MGGSDALPRHVFENHLSAIDFNAAGRPVCITSIGDLGLIYGRVLTDDVVALVPGITAPLVLRHNQDTDQYRLTGDGFVLGLMRGEGMSVDGLDDRMVTLESFGDKALLYRSLTMGHPR